MKKILCSKILTVLVLLTMQLSAFAVIPDNSFAGDVDILVDKLVEKGILSREDAQGILAETKQAAEMKQAQTTSSGSGQEKMPEWVRKINLTGDFRLRYQYEDTDEQSPRNRGRFRWRLGGSAEVVDNLKVGFGLASGSDDPRSTNQTFENTFSSKSLQIDYAYAQYTPFKWLTLTGGKFKNPLWTPSDLLWDTDINPEGASVGFTVKSEPATIFFTSGLWVIDENKTGGDPLMFPLQLGADWKIAKNVNLKAAASYYIFSSVKGKTLDFSSKTNTLVPGDGLKFDYNAFSLGAELGFKDLVVPYVGLFGEYVYNPDPSKGNDGYLAGIKVGDKKVSDKGQWQLQYSYRRLGKDAWIDAFPDSDFFGGATNVRGHEVIAEYGLMKNVSAGIDYYHTKSMGTGIGQDLLQCDLLFKF